MLEKAKIKVLEGPNAKEIAVMFNPSDYNISSFIAKPKESSSFQFNTVSIGDFSVSLFFDTYENQSNQNVKSVTKEISDLIMPVVEGKDTKRPPICLFVWGDFCYQGIVTQVDQKFTMFLENGTPVRSTLDLTFTPYISQELDKKLKAKEACRKLWMVKSGDRLDLIAYHAMRDPMLWPEIATVNGITDPLAFPAQADIGRSIIIPD